MQTDFRLESSRKPLRMIQITDSHLYGQPEGTLLGLNTRESFEQVIDLLVSHHNDQKIDLIVSTGDIAQDAEAQSYRRFAEHISRLAAPFYWVPGNHDSRQVMQSLAEHQSAFQNRIVCYNWQVLMLDTSVDGEVHGCLAETELQRLQQQLSHLPQGVEHTIVCMHHNPLPGNAEWMSDIGLRNADALLTILQQHRGTVRAVVHGHVHQALDQLQDGIRYICAPSTCIQFKPHAGDFTLDLLAPAYRWFDLYEDGRIETDVERLQGYVVNVDVNAEGY